MQGWFIPDFFTQGGVVASNCERGDNSGAKGNDFE
jgi:hypothetical protein